jgi:hypothetical protein
VPADVFAVLADPTRRRLVEVLYDGERSVGDLVAAVDIAQPVGLSGVGLAGSPWPGPTCLDRAAARREILPRLSDSQE